MVILNCCYAKTSNGPKEICFTVASKVSELAGVLKFSSMAHAPVVHLQLLESELSLKRSMNLDQSHQSDLDQSHQSDLDIG